MTTAQKVCEDIKKYKKKLSITGIGYIEQLYDAIVHPLPCAGGLYANTHKFIFKNVKIPVLYASATQRGRERLRVLKPSLGYVLSKK